MSLLSTLERLRQAAGPDRDLPDGYEAYDFAEDPADDTYDDTDDDTDDGWDDGYDDAPDNRSAVKVAEVAPVVAPIDPRIEARRREVRDAGDARRRRRWLAIAVVTTVVALLYGLGRSAVFDVDLITVDGATRTSADEVRTATGIIPGAPLVGLDLAGAADRVRALPWVADAQVARDWDGTVRIAVVERTPIAAVNVGEGRWALVDRDRRVLATEAAPPAGTTALEGVLAVPAGQQVDPAAQGALDLAALLPPGVRTRVAVLRLLPTGDLEAGLAPAGRVALGPARDLPAKVLALRTMLGQVDLDSVCTVDVRVPDAPVLTRGPPCA